MKKLLIVVDYQKDFVDGSLGFDDAKKLDDYISYLKTQEGQHLPVVHCLENSEGWKLYGHVSEKIKPEDKCMYKPGFGSLELGNYLHDKSYQQITLVGIVSNICVISNAIICKAALPEVEICIDTKGISSNDLEMQNKALDILNNLQFKII